MSIRGYAHVSIIHNLTSDFVTKITVLIFYFNIIVDKRNLIDTINIYSGGHGKQIRLRNPKRSIY